MSEKLKAVADEASDYLNRIAGLFKPGVKLTLIVRTPDKDDQDFILTNDLPAEAIKALDRRQKQ